MSERLYTSKQMLDPHFLRGRKAKPEDSPVNEGVTGYADRVSCQQDAPMTEQEAASRAFIFTCNSLESELEELREFYNSLPRQLSDKAARGLHTLISTYNANR